MNFIEAVPYYLKALEIHVTKMGHDSLEVARIRSALANTYSALGEDDKAFEQSELSMSVLNNVTSSSDLINEEIGAATYRIGLGRSEEAIVDLKALAARAGKEKKRELRAYAYLSMARAYITQEKFADAKRCLEMVSEIHEKKEDCCHEGKYYAMFAGLAFKDLLILYEKMNEHETSVSYLKKVLDINEKLPQKLLSSVVERIFSLICLTRELEKGVPYLELAVERLKSNFGPKHLEVGWAYTYLGFVYHGSGQLETAAECFSCAKDILDVSLGPYHMDSVNTCQKLSDIYMLMGSFPKSHQLSGGGS